MGFMPFRWCKEREIFYLLLSCKMQITFRTTLLEATRLCGMGPESEITGFVRVNLTRAFRCIQKRLAHIDVTEEGCHESKVCLREKQRWERRILWCLRSPHTLQTLAKKTFHIDWAESAIDGSVTDGDGIEQHQLNRRAIHHRSIDKWEFPRITRSACRVYVVKWGKLGHPIIFISLINSQRCHYQIESSAGCAI